MKTVQWNVEFDMDDSDRFEAYAKKHKLTKKRLVVAALNAYLGKHGGPDAEADRVADHMIDRVIEVAKNEASLVVLRMLDELASRAANRPIKQAITVEDILMTKRTLALALAEDLAPS